MADWDSSDKPELTDEEALNFGTLLQADVVIVGISIANPTPSVMGDELKSFKGNLNARVLRTETGEELANISRTAVTANVDESAGGRESPGQRLDLPKPPRWPERWQGINWHPNWPMPGESWSKNHPR